MSAQTSFGARRTGQMSRSFPPSQTRAGTQPPASPIPSASGHPLPPATISASTTTKSTSTARCTALTRTPHRTLASTRIRGQSQVWPVRHSMMSSWFAWKVSPTMEHVRKARSQSATRAARTSSARVAMASPIKPTSLPLAPRRYIRPRSCRLQSARVHAP